jgi:hypothetical protein
VMSKNEKARPVEWWRQTYDGFNNVGAFRRKF